MKAILRIFLRICSIPMYLPRSFLIINATQVPKIYTIALNLRNHFLIYRQWTIPEDNIYNTYTSLGLFMPVVPCYFHFVACASVIYIQNI
jgi:hypothetical protein